MLRTVTAIRRTIRAALAATKSLRYTALSGEVAALVATGRLVRTGDLLDRLGADLPDGQKSWFGRHVAEAYRAMHGGADAIRVWAQHRTTGRWIHVHVYAPADPALFAGLASYKATRHLVQAQFAEEKAMAATQGAAYRVRGTSTDVTTCACCGRSGLRRTVVLVPLDSEGSEHGPADYYGTGCAAALLGWSSSRTRSAAKGADMQAEISRHYSIERARKILKTFGPLEGAPLRDRATALRTSGLYAAGTFTTVTEEINQLLNEARELLNSSRGLS